MNNKNFVQKEIESILLEYDIKRTEDYLNKDGEDLAVIYENIKIVQEEYNLSEEEIDDILEKLLER